MKIQPAGLLPFIEIAEARIRPLWTFARFVEFSNQLRREAGLPLRRHVMTPADIRSLELASGMHQRTVDAYGTPHVEILDSTPEM